MLGQRVNNPPFIPLKGDYLLFDPAPEAQMQWDKVKLFTL
jgi:hypothetical protein